MEVKWRILVLLCTVVLKGSRCSLQIDILRNDFLETEDELWSYVLAEDKHITDPLLHTVETFEKYDRKLQQVPQNLLSGMQVSRKTTAFLLIYTDLQKIHDLYEKFRIYQRKYLDLGVGLDDYDKKEALTVDITDDVLHDARNSLNQTIDRIYKQIFVTSPSILDELNEIKNDDYMCKNMALAPQQVFLHLHNALALAELKGYILTQFSCLAERLYEQDNYTQIALEVRQEFKRRTHKYITIFRSAMGRHKKVWRCDPEMHTRGVTYEEITRLLQFHIENEADINSDRSCKQTCGDYPHVKSVFGCHDSRSTYCKRRKSCRGRLLSCREASGTTACISSSLSNRRYDYLKRSDGTVLGKENHGCSGTTAPSWTRWFVYCSACLCLCDEEGYRSDRYFNLRPVLANIKENRVVTGVRLVKNNRIIHLQIQEGQLLPYGYINESTVRWVPVDNYRITDLYNVKQNVDYHMMTFEDRDLYLDDLSSYESDHIVTGVSFIKHAGNLKMQINVRKFDFVKGTLASDSHYIYGSGDRSKLYLEEPDIPTLFGQSVTNFNSDKYIEFTHTDLKKDAGQTTVPFIDIQPVVTSPASPLKGVGLYWKGRSGSGGFVAPIITVYDFEQQMGVVIPEPPKRIDDKKGNPITK